MSGQRAYFLSDLKHGLNIMSPQVKIVSIKANTVTFEDGKREAKKQSVGEWFLTYEEAENQKNKILDNNINRLKNQDN